MLINSRQLALALTLPEDAAFHNFYPGDNQAVLAHLRTFMSGGEKFIFLWGPEGVGRTHLLQACCQEVRAGECIYLDLAEPGLQPAILIGMEYFSLVCLDNLDVVIGRHEWELALFNFYNHVCEQGARLLISALTPPARQPCLLADLCSRLSAGLTLSLQRLTDDQKLNALKMRARARGLELSTEAGNFLLHHYPRNMNDLFSALNVLDKEALAAQRRLTIPLIKQVLNPKP